MSKIDVGPLAGYNSLTDHHLAGYFNNTRMRKHLIKSGLITRQGEVVPESVFRLNTSRKDHRRNVRDLLAQAIVHKTLDMERSRQVTIRRKLEEIAKIELVRRVRAERHRKGDEDILPLMSGRVRRPKRSPNRLRGEAHGSQGDVSDQGAGIDPIYVDADGMPLSPDAESRARLLKKFPDEEIDSKHLYALDSVALREYAKVLERYEKGRVAKSPYLMTQIPRPPTSGAPSSTRRPMTAAPGSGRVSRSATAKKQGNLVLHRTEPALMNQNRVQSMCEVEMRYYGQQVFTGREDVDPAQEVMVEQQHCGGNTLTVFKRRILPGTVFTFCSRRHRGYPFSLTFFINGVKDSRLSACCEYRHSKGSRLGGKQGHFGIVRVTGAAPCYKCQVERGAIPVESSIKPKRSSKSAKAAVESSDEYKDDFEEDQDKVRDDEKADSPKPEYSSSKSSSKSNSKSSSAASSPRQTADAEDAVASKQDSDSDRQPEEDEIAGKPVGFSDKEDEVEVKSHSSSSSSSRSSSPDIKEADKDGHKIAVDSDSSDAESRKASSLTEHPTVTVPVEDDDEKEEEEEAKVSETEEDTGKQEETADEEPAPEPKSATFSVITGDDLGAGTNARIFCRLIGTEGESDVIELGNESESERRFERGSVDSFRSSISGFQGRPKQLEIWHNGSGLGATWLLDKVLVLIDGEEFEFEFKNWLEGDSGDGEHHQIIDVGASGEAPAQNNALIEALEAEPVAAREHADSVSSSSSSSSDARPEEFKLKGAAAAESSSSPSSSSDEDEIEEEPKQEDKSGAEASESGPDGGYDPDADLNPAQRPLLADAVDQAEVFRADGDVGEFVKKVSPDDPDSAYTVEVINTSLDHSQLSRLASVMKEHPIECLNIRNGRIDDEKLQIILDVLEQKDELKLLNLNCNHIGPKGAALIAERLVRWTRLELILLHGNPLLDDGINEIVTAIINRNNRAKDAGILTNPLRSLDLGDSEMTNQGAYVVCQLLAQNIPLESLELTGNRKIGLDGWRQVGDALGSNRCLRTLSVDYCSLRDDHLSALISRLSGNTSLVSLDLEGNEITDVGGQQLRDMLVENGTLCDVSLRPGNTDMNDDLSEEIVEMASRNADD